MNILYGMVEYVTYGTFIINALESVISIK